MTFIAANPKHMPQTHASFSGGLASILRLAAFRWGYKHIHALSESKNCDCEVVVETSVSARCDSIKCSRILRLGSFWFIALDLQEHSTRSFEHQQLQATPNQYSLQVESFFRIAGALRNIQESIGDIIFRIFPPQWPKETTSPSPVQIEASPRLPVSPSPRCMNSL